MTDAQVIRIGTRKSPLAMVQATHVLNQLKSTYPNHPFEIVGINTLGDQDKTTSLQELGGKGIFIKALEQELLHNTIDIAVHSAKDITSKMHPDLDLTGVCTPTEICDSLVFTNGAKTLSELPASPKIATGSLRRKSLLNEMFESVDCVPIRGNVATRLENAADSKVDGVLLSEVGLNRLDLNPPRHLLDPKDFIPAPSQGVIAIQQRKKDTDIEAMIRMISDDSYMHQFRIERYIMESLGFDCRIPLGIYLESDASGYQLFGYIANESLTKSQRFEARLSITQWESDIEPTLNRVKQWLKEHD